MEPDIAAADRPDAADGLERLVALEHLDPHSLLGAHLEPDGVVVRVFRPDAERVTLLIDGEKNGRAMTRVHPAGAFEIRLKGRRELIAYRLETLFPGRTSTTTPHPY